MYTHASCMCTHVHAELEHARACACMRTHALGFLWSLFSKNIFI